MRKTGGRSFSPLWIRLTSVLLYESSRQFTWYSRGITNLGTVRLCFKTVRIRSYSDPHFSRIFSHSDWIRRDTKYRSVFSPNAGKCGKNADQNNSEYELFLRTLFFIKNMHKQLYRCIITSTAISLTVPVVKIRATS